MVMFRPESRHKIDEEAENVEEEDERNNPLEHRRNIIPPRPRTHPKSNSERRLDQNKREFNPERPAQDGVLTEMNPETLVLPADEDGGYDISDDEDGEEDIVQTVMAQGVEDAEKDKACSAGNGGDDGDARVNFLPDGGIGGEDTTMTQPALEDKGNVEGDDGYSGHGDEEGFEAVGANVRYVCYGLVLIHGGVLLISLV